MSTRQDSTFNRNILKRMALAARKMSRSLLFVAPLFLIQNAGTPAVSLESNDTQSGNPVSIRSRFYRVTSSGDTVVSLTELPEGTLLDVSSVRLWMEEPSTERSLSETAPRFSRKGSGPNIEGAEQFLIDETSSRLPVEIDYSMDAEFGDVDGDGDLDCILANTDAQRNRLLINDGHGVFSDESAFRLPVDADFSLAVALGDADGDGDLDLFVANNFAFQLPDCVLISGRNRLYLNNGHGLFFDGTEARLPESIAASTDAEWVDTDHDGDLDLVVANSIRPGECHFLGGGRLQILENTGGGFFIDVTDDRMPEGFHSDVSVKSGDVDGDGDMDLVVADPFEGTRLLINTGSGCYSDQSEDTLPGMLGSTREIILFDIDTDGDLDLFCANDSSSVRNGLDGAQNRLLINNGSGFFSDETGERLPRIRDVSLGGVAVGDVNGDGAADIFVANNWLLSGGRRNGLLLNSGLGSFADGTEAGIPDIADVTSGVVFGDVDNDGMPDVLVANYGEQNMILMGHREPRGGPVDPEMLKGDADVNGAVDIMDVLSIINYILGQGALSEEGLFRADCTGDGQVNIMDAIGIVNVILGLGECGPSGCKAAVTPEVLSVFESLESYLTEVEYSSLLALVSGLTSVPMECTLSQNYPNPFNPDTEISFQLSAISDQTTQHTTLKIYNLLGQEIRTLVDESKAPGSYTVTWDVRDNSGHEIPSGFYFYTLQVGKFTATRKMIMMK